MEKERGQIKIVETDDGYRIEVKGKDWKDMLSCCCLPIGIGGKGIKVECCEPEEKKK